MFCEDQSFCASRNRRHNDVVKIGRNDVPAFWIGIAPIKAGGSMKSLSESLSSSLKLAHVDRCIRSEWPAVPSRRRRVADIHNSNQLVSDESHPGWRDRAAIDDAMSIFFVDVGNRRLDVKLKFDWTIFPTASAEKRAIKFETNLGDLEIYKRRDVGEPLSKRQPPFRTQKRRLRGETAFCV